MHSRQDSSEAGFSGVGLALVVTSVFLLGAVIFGVWTFLQMLDYKTNVDGHVKVAVAAAKQQEDAVKDAAFAEAEKQPLKPYNGPSSYGSIAIYYPKTWSGYVTDKRTSSPFVDGYFYPGVVPDLQAPSSVYALRVQVVQNSYSNELNSFATFVKQGSAKVSPYAVPKVPNIIGSRIDGKLSGSKSGSMVLLPLRNMTLKIWTEAPQFQADFNDNILPNFTFAP